MINLWINKEDLLNLLMGRIEYWTGDKGTLGLYNQYLRDLIDSGYFKGVKLDINSLIDSLYIQTIIMDKEELDENGLLPENNEILAKDIDNNLYLVNNY